MTKAERDLQKYSPEVDRMSAQEIVRWAMEEYGERLVLASSFGAEDVVLIDMTSRVGRPIRVVTLDTGRLHQETYTVMDAVRDRYNLEIEVYSPQADVPYNVLHDQGFPSIGCAPCTRAVGSKDDLRAGRWWWEQPDTKECGLHLPAPVSTRSRTAQ